MRGERRFEDQQQDERRTLTTQPGRRPSDWYGYVQPYRYYGPGYRGVGYYSVLYQGPETSEYQGDADEPETQFDQRNVHYGQGQGSGAAWDDRRRWGGRWDDRPGTERPGAWLDRARQFGEFAGRGPKGYRRSDERIREDVSDRLTDSPDIDASDIEVKVTDGVVTLAGAVNDRWAKRLAEDIAETVTGVRDVMNQLTVGHESMGQGMTAGTTGTPASSRQPRNGRRPATSASR